jgi:DEAD/DEAH box helicase domain-containing protein
MLQIFNASERKSSILETAILFAKIIKCQCRTIAFCGSRKLAELVLKYTLDDLSVSHSDLVDKVASYRGGYNKEERRAIEQGMFNGQLLGIAATCALELGVDIGWCFMLFSILKYF